MASCYRFFILAKPRLTSAQLTKRTFVCCCSPKQISVLDVTDFPFLIRKEQIIEILKLFYV